MSENEKLQQTSKEDKAAKSKKDAKKSKPSVFARIGKWFKDMKAELKKVVWPTPKQLATNTGVALFVMALAAVVLWGFDELAGLVVNVIFELAG